MFLSVIHLSVYLKIHDSQSTNMQKARYLNKFYVFCFWDKLWLIKIDVRFDVKENNYN